MTVSVRMFEPKDAPEFRLLHGACLRHYGIAPATPEQEDRVIRCLVDRRHMACHLALHQGRPVGFATWGLNIPAGPGLSLVMKELFVAPEARKLGVGTSLIATLIDVARAEECERLDWATDGSNAGAQAFYDAIGAKKLTKQAYRIPSGDFDRFHASLTAHQS